MNMLGQSEELKRTLTSVVKKVIEEQTSECLRTFKAEVVTPPNKSSGKCEIRLAGQQTTMLLPYSTAVEGVSKGEMVWVSKIGNAWRNAIVWQKIDFKTESSSYTSNAQYYDKDISVNDWQDGGSTFRITVPSTEHKLKVINGVNLEVLNSTENHYENADFTYKVYHSGAVTIVLDKKADCRIIIEGE